MEVGLSGGWVESVSDVGCGAPPAPRFDQPVLQVAGVRSVVPTSEPLEHVLRLSDGVYCLEAMLISELGHLVIDGVLRTGTVLRVLEYCCATRQNSRFVIIMRLEIIKPHSSLIGCPRLYGKLDSKSECCISRSATHTDHPNNESYSSGLCIMSSCSASGTVRVATELAYNPTCGADHSPQHCMGGSSIAPTAEPVILKTVAQIKEGNLGFPDKQGLVNVKAVISYVSTENFCYKACPLMVNGRRCTAKLLANVDGTWHCERCSRCFESKRCDCRFVLVIQIKDPTGIICALAFQEAGEEIFCRTAKELYLMKCEDQDYEQFDGIIANALSHQYIFKLKVERGEYDGKQLMKCTVIEAERVDSPTESSEFGSSMAASNGFSDLKESSWPQPAKTSNRDYALSSGGAKYPFCTDQLGELQGTEYGPTLTAVLEACSTCGFVGHTMDSCPMDMESSIEQHLGPKGFISSFYDSSLFDLGLAPETYDSD